MSKKNRLNEYNRQVKRFEEATEGKKINVSPKLLEEFGKGKKNLPKENTDELPEE